VWRTKGSQEEEVLRLCIMLKCFVAPLIDEILLALPKLMISKCYAGFAIVSACMPAPFNGDLIFVMPMAEGQTKFIIRADL
jgi:hypothetical protein